MSSLLSPIPVATKSYDRMSFVFAGDREDPVPKAHDLPTWQVVTAGRGCSLTDSSKKRSAGIGTDPQKSAGGARVFHPRAFSFVSRDSEPALRPLRTSAKASTPRLMLSCVDMLPIRNGRFPVPAKDCAL
ncbi:MAG TPA: hypothetical protein VEI07_11505 [Planctomycetaceae bacterium]|nr:hypothetical protein [Planctomycetaceae bacterium]